MKFPIVRLAAVAAVGTVALLAQAGMTSTAAAVPNSAALPTGPSGVHTSVSRAAVPPTKSRPSKSTTASHRSVTAKVASATTVAVAAKCDGVTDNTAAIQAAVNAAGKVPGGAIVTIPAGVCAVFGRIPVSGQNGVTIQGAGQTRTFIVQHGASNIFQITSPGNTVEDMNLDTATYNPGIVPIPKSPVPAVLFSNANNTTVLNITAETGTGFGMRLTGPKPCYTFGITGSVVTNLIMVNHGTGGFAALDIDCQNGARLTNINIHGGILALFNDTNTVLLNETYYGVNKCQPAWFVTGPASNILIQNVVTYAGAGVIHSSRHGVATGITVINQTFASALHC
jgi:Pectate lyase superfamily protein